MLSLHVSPKPEFAPWSPESNFLPRVSLSIPPCPTPPTTRLWRGAGLTSLSITEARWVTSAWLDGPLGWVGTVSCECICKKTHKGHTDGTGPCWWRLNWLKQSTTAHKIVNNLISAAFSILSILSYSYSLLLSFSLCLSLSPCPCLSNCGLLLHEWI